MFKRFHVICIVLSLFMIQQCHAADTGKPKRLFYVSFDKWDTVADESAGSPKSDFGGSLMLRQPPGAYSRAGMRLEPGETLNYDLAGNLNTQRGTISFWSRPYMWSDNHLTRRITFFSINCEDFHMMFNIGRAEDTMFKFDAWSTKYLPEGQRAVARVPDWSKEDGKWHKIDATWDTIEDKELALYIDGKIENKVVFDVEIPESKKGKISLIPLNNWLGCPFNNTKETTLIDEVEIWDRPLSEGEILARYNKTVGIATNDTVVSSKPPMYIEFVPLIEKKEFLFQVKLNNLPSAWYDILETGNVQFNIALQTPAGKKAGSQTLKADKRMEMSLPVGQTWEDGNYKVIARLTSPRMEKPIEYTKEIFKPKTPWLGSSLGRNDNEVPSPWTPLKCEADTVTCWGRSYRLNGAFPSGILNHEKEMLSGPISLRLKTDTGEYALGQGPVKWTDCKPAKALYSGRKKDGLIDFEYSGSVEFDGLIISNIKIIPPTQGMRVESLVLDIPLKSEYVKWMRNPGMFNPYVSNGTLPTPIWDGKSPLATDFIPYIWVGNLKAGFDWFCESDKNWNYAEGAKPCRLVPDGDTTFLRFEIVSEPADVKKPLEYTFGFQATPVKSLRKDRSFMRPTAGPLAREPYANMTSIGYDYTFEYISWFVPQEWPRDQFQERADGFNNLDVKLDILNHLGIKALPYTSGVIIADNNPVWDFFAAAWQNKAGPVSRGATGGGYTTRRDGKKFSMTGADPGSWSPFLAYMADQMLSNPAYNKGIGGIYVDNTAPVRQKNPYNGSGFYNDAFGRSGYSYCILGLRDLAMRLLRVIRKNKGDEGILWLHAHNLLILPIHGLGDYFYPGEQYGYLVKPADGEEPKRTFYMDYLPLDIYRVEMNAQPYGVPQVLLHLLPGIDGKPAVNSIYPISRENLPTENIIAMCVLHDVPFSLYTLNPESISEFFSIVDRTGMADAEFLPYWEENGLTTGDQDSKVSAYRTKDGITVVVVNFSGQDRKVTLKIDPKSYGWENKHIVAFDERSKWGIQVYGDTLHVPVGRKNYGIVSLKAVPE
ncbi:MAG: glycoside hydrolase domain-containing protein [Candidatus Omnitrophota bacterium]